jgi:hypothetical protein
VGGLSALEWRGLQRWHRDEVTVLVDDRLEFDPVPGIVFTRTRRPLTELRDASQQLPVARVEPAALLHAGYQCAPRTAQGLLAALVQQRLTTAPALVVEIDRLRPLRRANLLRRALAEIEGGAASMSELDVRRLCRQFGFPPPRRQVRRRDAAGRVRFLDCEWLLPDGTVLVLEVDGAFHMEVEHWEDDLARQRRLSTPGRLIVRCTSRELRDEPDLLARDLRALGLGRSTA